MHRGVPGAHQRCRLAARVPLNSGHDGFFRLRYQTMIRHVASFMEQRCDTGVVVRPARLAKRAVPRIDQENSGTGLLGIPRRRVGRRWTRHRFYVVCCKKSRASMRRWPLAERYQLRGAVPLLAFGADAQIEEKIFGPHG